MTSPELAEPVVKVAVAGKMVSKRSARTYVEDGEEHSIADFQAKRASRCEDIGVPTSELMERRGSVSSTKTVSETSSSISSNSERGAVEPWSDPKEAQSWENGRPLPLYVSNVLYKNGAVAIDDELQTCALSPTGRPSNFGVVVPGVYRCGYPQPCDYKFIQALGLKTVLTLVQKELPAAYKPFLNANHIKHHVFNMKGTKKEDIPIRTMRSILRLVLDRRNHPMLIHCNHGKHRTGCVVGVVRKVTGWEVSSILEEYKSFAAPKERECDIKYISSFDLAALSNLFAPRSPLALQTRAFLRAAVFAMVVLFIWLASGSRFARDERNKYLPFQ